MFRVNLSLSLPPHAKLSVMDDQLADVLLEIYVLSETPFETVNTQVYSLFEMVTAQDYSSSFKFRVNMSSGLPALETVLEDRSPSSLWPESPSRLLPVSPSSLLPESPSSLLPESPASSLPDSSSSLLPVSP